MAKDKVSVVSWEDYYYLLSQGKSAQSIKKLSKKLKLKN